MKTEITPEQVTQMIDNACAQKVTPAYNELRGEIGNLKIALERFSGEMKLSIKDVAHDVSDIKKNLRDSSNVSGQLQQTVEELYKDVEKLKTERKIETAKRKYLYSILGFIGITSLPNLLGLVSIVANAVTKFFTR